MTGEEIIIMLDDITNDAVNLTPWEEEFIASMSRKVESFGSGAYFTQSQVESIERIYQTRIP